MTVSPLNHPSTLRRDPNGVIRIGNGRITLDLIVTAFELGSTPEQMVQQFPSLSVEQVYATIGIYLHNQVELDVYLADRRQQGSEMVNEIAGQPHMQNIRQRLLARRQDSTH